MPVENLLLAAFAGAGLAAIIWRLRRRMRADEKNREESEKSGEMPDAARKGPEAACKGPENRE